MPCPGSSHLKDQVVDLKLFELAAVSKEGFSRATHDRRQLSVSGYMYSDVSRAETGASPPSVVNGSKDDR